MEHDKCLSFIKQAVAESDVEKIVVVTHHLPSYKVVAPYYKGDNLTSAFATELGEYIAGSRINAWIFDDAPTGQKNKKKGSFLEGHFEMNLEDYFEVNLGNYFKVDDRGSFVRIFHVTRDG